MTSTQWAAVERQARIFVGSSLSGPDADAVVRAIVAWEWGNPHPTPAARSAAWSRLRAMPQPVY